MAQMIALSNYGVRVGEDHPKAVLTNHELDLLLQLREQDGLGYGVLAKIFEVPKASVACWCKGTRRNVTAESFKRQKAPASAVCMAEDTRPTLPA